MIIAHHSYLVNPQHITAVKPDGEGQLLLSNGHQVPLARLRRKNFFSCFSML